MDTICGIDFVGCNIVVSSVVQKSKKDSYNML